MLRALYRQQVPLAIWIADLEAACRDGGGELAARLQRIQPANLRSADLVAGLRRVMALRPEAEAWVIRQLPTAWGDLAGIPEMIDAAASAGQLPLWSALLRHSAPPARFDAEVRGLLRSGRSPADQRVWLRALVGGGAEFNGPGFGLMSVRMLSDDTAVELYRQFADLVRGPYRLHVAPHHASAYPKLLDVAIRAGDDELVNFLACRLLISRGHTAEWKAAQSRIAKLLDVSRGTPAFRRRAASILARVPAYAIANVDRLIQHNMLARLLFARSAHEWLEDQDPALISDLLESPNIHVQALGWRALAQPDARAAALAEANLDALIPGLLRPLHRGSRLVLLTALERAITGPEAAARVHRRAREALDLPDRRYPRDALIGLIGRLLARYPELRASGEAPVVYADAARREGASR